MLRRAVESLKVGIDGEKHDENQYISLISDILLHGEEIVGRNGTTKAVFGAAMVFNLEDGTYTKIEEEEVPVAAV